MQGPADTLTYMIAGFVVIFGAILGYLLSLVVRWRNLNQEEDLLKDLQKTEEKG